MEGFEKKKKRLPFLTQLVKRQGRRLRGAGCRALKKKGTRVREGKVPLRANIDVTAGGGLQGRGVPMRETTGTCNFPLIPQLPEELRGGDR